MPLDLTREFSCALTMKGDHIAHRETSFLLQSLDSKVRKNGDSTRATTDAYASAINFCTT